MSRKLQRQMLRAQQRQADPHLAHDYVRKHFGSPPPSEPRSSLQESAKTSSPLALFRLARRKLALDPDNVEATLFLAESAIRLGFACIALQTFQRLGEFCPDLSTIAEIEKKLQRLDFSPNSNLALGALQEWLSFHLSENAYTEALAVAHQALTLEPNDPCVRNNLSLAQLGSGQLLAALETAQGVLDLQPDNVHALANLVHFCMRQGMVSQAQRYGEMLKSSRANADDRSVKVAEGLSRLGDDRGVLELFASATKEEKKHPTFLHLAAAAHARLDDWAQARKFWLAASKQGPCERIGECLDNAALPLERRHSAWAFGLNDWIALNQIGRVVKSESDVMHAMPELAGLLPVLLDRGDPLGTELAVRLCQQGGPEWAACLKDFACSKRGNDDLRKRAAYAAAEAGLLDPGPLMMWIRGCWSPMLVMAYTFYEKKPTLPKKIQKLADRALEALAQEKWSQAEDLLRQALSAAPEEASLINNLAAVYQNSGREPEAHALLESLYARQPDYSFAAIHVASYRALAGDFDEAHRILRPVLAKQRLHFAEAAALCQAQLQLAHMEGSNQGEFWEQLWWRIEEQEPEASIYRPAWLRRRQEGRETLRGPRVGVAHLAHSHRP